ncbi:divalent cation tolerance protein CutA [Deinococcus sp.]|uniref:divalent cation tolerance protein CutA n=1 Tax=Deinococcus sp. TaxID=47478 RepID=UPI003C7B3B9A
MRSWPTSWRRSGARAGASARSRRARAGGRLSATLAHERLASCVNVLPDSFSVYRWKGEFAEDAEALGTCAQSAQLSYGFVPIPGEMGTPSTFPSSWPEQRR